MKKYIDSDGSIYIDHSPDNSMQEVESEGIVLEIEELEYLQGGTGCNPDDCIELYPLDENGNAEAGCTEYRITNHKPQKKLLERLNKIEDYENRSDKNNEGMYGEG